MHGSRIRGLARDEYSEEFRKRERDKNLALPRMWSGMRSSDVPGRPAYPIWHPTTFVAPVPDFAMIAAANSNRFDFCLDTLPSRQRSDTSAANKNCRMRLMIGSKSQCQATLPEEQSGRLTSCKIGDSVHYRSLFGLLGPQTFPKDPFLAYFRIADYREVVRLW